MATVADIMDREPVTVSPEATIEDVVRTLKLNELPGVPVVEHDRRVIDAHDVAAVVATRTGIPVDEIVAQELGRA